MTGGCVHGMFPRREAFTPARSPLAGRHARPVVGTEGGDREAVAAVQVAVRVVGPGVADGDRVADLVRPDLDLVLADDAAFRPDEFPVDARDGEAAGLGDVERLEAVAD